MITGRESPLRMSHASALIRGLMQNYLAHAAKFLALLDWSTVHRYKLPV
jgi:hypothetical protein